MDESIKLASAVGRVRRDRRQTNSQIGETAEIVLTKLLTNKLEKIDFVPLQQERVSVITPTRKSPQTSTPSTSPRPPPLPPRTCHNLGPIILPNTSCSPTCSELSSINGEVFLETDISESSQLPGISSLAQANSAYSLDILPPSFLVTTTMEQAKKEIGEKNRNLVILMRNFDTDDLTLATVHRCDVKLEEIEKIRNDLVMCMEAMAADFASEMQQQDSLSFRNTINKVEADVKQYLRAMTSKAHALKIDQSQPSNVSRNDAASLRMAAAFEKSMEKAELVRENTLDESRREARSKNKNAIAKARSRYDALVEEIDELKETVTKVTDWSKESNITVGRAMKDIKSWKDAFSKVKNFTRNLKSFSSIKTSQKRKQMSYLEKNLSMNYLMRLKRQ